MQIERKSWGPWVAGRKQRLARKRLQEWELTLQAEALQRSAAEAKRWREERQIVRLQQQETTQADHNRRHSLFWRILGRA